MKKKIGIINVINNNTKGKVIMEAIKNNIPDKILIFIEIKAKMKLINK